MHQGRAVGDLGGGALELQVGKEREPQAKGGTVRFVGERCRGGKALDAHGYRDGDGGETSAEAGTRARGP
ncbi:MAG: hypothetical protein ABR606_04570 [Vicinamibacterales bacterium]